MKLWVGWAHITVNGVHKQIGHYATEKEAALAYNQAAQTYFGVFALLNVVA
jgi:hypothetical protein